jgi:AbrB family looped-hinge helix DNA binding protein
MDVTISPKFQILIPKEVRKALNIKKGEKYHILVRAKTMTLVPDLPLASLRGFLGKTTAQFQREEEERL